MKINTLLILCSFIACFCALACSRVEKSTEIYDSADLAALYGEIGIEPVAYQHEELDSATAAAIDAEGNIDEVDSAAAMLFAEEEATDEHPNPNSAPRFHERIRVRNIGKLSEVFNDSNYRQYAYAEKLGIAPVRSLNDAWNTRRPLVKITTNKNFAVDKLTHSLPYLVPEAAILLNDIGKNFIDSLKSRGGDGYRVIATSLLRTPHTVKRLRRVNVNATDSSTHQFGTTFDLSWRRFDCLDSTRTLNEVDLKNLLAEVLFDLRAQGRCLVKYERLTACFHVTAIR